MTFLSLYCACVTATWIKMQNIPAPAEGSFLPPQNHYPILTNLIGCHYSAFQSHIFPGFEFHINGIISYILFNIEHLLLNLMSMKFIHFVAFIRSFIIFHSNLLLYKYATMCFSIIDWLLVYFQFLALMRKAAASIMLLVDISPYFCWAITLYSVGPLTFPLFLLTASHHLSFKPPLPSFLFNHNFFYLSN